MADLGSDFHAIEDLNANLTVVTERTCLAQALVRRIISPRGSLFYDEDYGTDVRQFLNAPPRPASVAQAVESECLKDERVVDVTATVEYLEANTTLQIKLIVEDETEEEFALTVLVDELTVELLEENL